MVELNGALSNPLESSKDPLERLRCVVRGLLERQDVRRESRQLRARTGKISEAVRAVVVLRDEPIRMIEIHAAVELLLGESVSRGTVKRHLSAGVTRGEYVRVDRGRYLPHRSSFRDVTRPARFPAGRSGLMTAQATCRPDPSGAKLG
jgi:ElaB/YqjD/DUF883 family membrane-anchored ribosome-binding protein